MTYRIGRELEIAVKSDLCVGLGRLPHGGAGASFDIRVPSQGHSSDTARLWSCRRAPTGDVVRPPDYGRALLDNPMTGTSSVRPVEHRMITQPEIIAGIGNCQREVIRLAQPHEKASIRLDLIVGQRFSGMPDVLYAVPILIVVPMTVAPDGIGGIL